MYSYVCVLCLKLRVLSVGLFVCAAFCMQVCYSLKAATALMDVQSISVDSLMHILHFVLKSFKYLNPRP